MAGVIKYRDSQRSSRVGQLEAVQLTDAAALTRVLVLHGTFQEESYRGEFQGESGQVSQAPARRLHQPEVHVIKCMTGESQLETCEPVSPPRRNKEVKAHKRE